MKLLSYILALGLLLSLGACTKRSAPAMASALEERETVRAEITAEETASAQSSTPDVDLAPLSESSLGQALLGCVKEVNGVTVISTETGEVIYESTDDVLSQGFYDAMQIVNEEFESLDIRPIDFEVHFPSELGIERNYGIWVNFTKDNNVIVQSEDGIWDLPIAESNWIRARLSGLV